MLLCKGGDDPGKDVYIMHYSGFGVIVAKAIQEQQGIINKQQAEIDLLNKLVTVLLQKIETEVTKK